MKYKPSDKVRIKSLDWYNENHNDDYNVVFANGWHFSKPMSNFCGKELIIERISNAVNPPHYMMRDNIFAWTDEMIEGLVEDTITTNEQPLKPSNISLDKEMDEHQKLCDEIMAIQGIEPIEAEIEEVWHCPEGYQFKDENGNVINATKIVLEKKKKEYPKTYEECCRVMGIDSTINHTIGTHFRYRDTIEHFIKLLICRDAYWKIAGEEMGLGEDWKPDWNNISDKYCIYFVSGDAWSKECQTRQCPFAFPTEEMRDAFYENFKKLINSCKELL